MSIVNPTKIDLKLDEDVILKDTYIYP